MGTRYYINFVKKDDFDKFLETCDLSYMLLDDEEYCLGKLYDDKRAKSLLELFEDTSYYNSYYEFEIIKLTPEKIKKIKKIENKYYRMSNTINKFFRKYLNDDVVAIVYWL